MRSARGLDFSDDSAAKSSAKSSDYVTYICVIVKRAGSSPHRRDAGVADARSKVRSNDAKNVVKMRPFGRLESHFHYKKM